MRRGGRADRWEVDMRSKKRFGKIAVAFVALAATGTLVAPQAQAHLIDDMARVMGRVFSDVFFGVPRESVSNVVRGTSDEVANVGPQVGTTTNATWDVVTGPESPVRNAGGPVSYVVNE